MGYRYKLKIMRKSKKQINSEISKMHEMFPSNKTELLYTTPFQLLVAVILSAQTTDKQVNKVTKSLFKKIRSPDDVLEMWLARFQQSIKSIWLYLSKSKYIFNTAQLLSGNWDNYNIPENIEELMKFPWVGIKTAKVIAHVLYDKKVVAVDTHVHRIANRLGWVHTKTPEQTSRLLEWLIYEDNKSIAHHSIILFGRYHCKALKPQCTTCPLQSNCLYYKKLDSYIS